MSNQFHHELSSIVTNNKQVLPNLLDQGLVEQLFDLLDDGIIVHDENRKIYLVNKAVEEITGVKREVIVGKDCHDVFPGGLCGAACAFKTGVEPSNVDREAELIFSRPDNGTVVRLKVRSTPIYLNKRKRGVLAVFKDSTELKDLEWRLNKHREFHGMVGVSDAISEIFDTIRAVGPSDYPVLITGESGTGKELVAGAIHRESSRKAGPFVPVNCGALPENILESELFGHVRGAFTGAIRDKKGRFELADGGTLFLDEVGELPLHMQSKLLRVLQEKVFERVGGESSVKVDVRIVAATNRDLRKMAKDGDFREDLFYRLCVVPIDLPPLRDRREDIPHIVDAILKKVVAETGKEMEGLEDSAMQRLVSYSWPGNVRELINALQYASVRCPGKRIANAHLPFEVRANEELLEPGRTSIVSRPGATSTAPSPAPTKRGKKKLSPEIVLEAVNACGGNKLKAAKQLGVGRATLYRFLDDHPDLLE